MPPANSPKQFDTVLEAQKELLAHSYSNGMAYMNVILGAGYAGFFATWSFTKDALTYSTKMGSALLICASLLSFIIFEVLKMYYLSKSLIALGRAVGDPANFGALLNQWKVEAQAREMRMGRIWAVSFWFTLVTGISAGLTLMSAFIHGLLING
jgi:hypothetical protein